MQAATKKRKGPDGPRVGHAMESVDARTPPTRALHTASDAETLLREHERCLCMACELLEEPSEERAVAAGLHRAAAAGHTWLTRISSQGHADKLVQPALLASARPPVLTYVSAVPRRLAKTGVLSELQLEALLYAGQCHSRPLRPSGSRHGFLLADGAGVGKGRTQAAIILDAWLQAMSALEPSSPHLDLHVLPRTYLTGSGPLSSRGRGLPRRP